MAAMPNFVITCDNFAIVQTALTQNLFLSKILLKKIKYNNNKNSHRNTYAGLESTPLGSRLYKVWLELIYRM